NLADGGHVLGVTTASLTLSNVLRGDAGGYSVVISNAYGRVTGAVATLTVIDPAINGQPASQAGNAGDSVAFSVAAAGTAPLSYQWRKDLANLADGGNVSGAAAANLTLSNVLGGDAGGYSVVISSSYGSVTSAVAMLTVNDPVISVQPASQTRNAGDSVTFVVAV